MRIVDGTEYLDEIKQLIVEYSAALDRDLSFQEISHELDDIKSKYTYPNGRVLASVTPEGKIVGCVAYRKMSDNKCEMKRLYVKPEYRKLKLGRQLIDEIIQKAKQDGYEQMYLDTIKPLQSAIHLYKKFGFVEIPAYYDNPMDDVVYMMLEL